MQSDKKFIVYIHRLKNDGRVYVGQTCTSLEQRSGSNGYKYKHCPKFYHAIQKYGWENFQHIVIYKNLTLEQANIKEQELIKLYNSIENGFNLVPGGRNHLWSDQYKEKMKERNLGSKNPNYGKPRSQETKRKIGEANKISQQGKKHSKQTKDKMSKAHKKYCPILCIETQKIYNCLVDASMDVANTKQAGHIKEVCDGKRKTAFKYHWKYLDKDKEK